MSASKNVLGMIDKYNELKAEMMKNLKDNFSSIFEEFFNEVPEIKYVTWCQYVPHFNDGEPCEFTMHEFNFIFGNEVNEDGSPVTANDLLGSAYPFDDNSWFDIGRAPSDWYKVNYPDTYYAWHRKFDKLGDRGPIIEQKVTEMDQILRKIPDEIYENIFGSNASIVIERTNTHVDEYDCGY